MAGTITAIGENDQGVVGVVKNNKMPLYIGRVLGSNGGGTFSDVAAAALLCEENGANVINMSLGGGGSSAPQVFQDAVDTILARSERVLFVAAAGNGGNNSKLWPASMPEVMSVAAVDSNKNRASFSQFNNEVDISGPGVSTRSTVPTTGYGYKSGTSMATPHVAGVAAKVWSHAPYLTAQDIRTLLESTAEDLGTTGRDDYYGWGLVDALAAYQALPSTDAPTSSPSVCGDSLSETYLSKIREANIDLYAPSAYFRGGATKFISSSGETQLDSDRLCVDGAASYDGPIQLYDDGTHGDDVANDGVYSRE